MAGRQISFLSIGELAKGYRRREFSPVDAVEEALDRIERFDGRLNAWITVLADEARAAAKDTERALVAGEDLGPLHGVPMALKDNIDMAGVRTTCASRILRDHVAAKDAAVVQSLRGAGAIILGKTNLLEFAYGIVHPDYGQCNNPWDTGRTAGGSSGGSAAAVSAGMAFAALGTDTGGSIRVPASYCGIAGLKPTHDLVSRRGVFPLSWSLDCVGPLARSAADAAIVLRAIAGPSRGGSRGATPASGEEPETRERGMAGVRVGVAPEHLGGDLRPGVRAAFDRALETMRNAGAEIVDVGVPSLAFADDALMPILGPEATLVHERWLRARPEDYAEMTRAQLELGALVSSTDYLRAQRFRSLLAAELDAALERADVIAAPTVPWVAPAEDPVVADAEGATEARRTGPYNLTGHPAVTVPCGPAENGLPAGLQFAGPRVRDERLLAVAETFQIASGWRPTCPRGLEDEPAGGGP